MVFKAEDDGQRRGGRNSAVEESSDDGYGVIGGAAGAASALVRRHTRTETAADHLSPLDWLVFTGEALRRRPGSDGPTGQIASKVLRPGMRRIGRRNEQIDTALADDVADRPAAGPGRRARGRSANECERLGHTKPADCHRLPSLRMVDQYCVSTSRAWCAGLLSLRCGWTTYDCGRPPHRGSG